MSRTVGVAELRQNLSRYLRRVEDGERLVVTDHHRPVAELIPLARPERTLDRLIAEGRARVDVLRSDSTWFGITYPEDKPHVVGQLRRLVDGGAYPAPLWGG